MRDVLKGKCQLFNWLTKIASFWKRAKIYQKHILTRPCTCFLLSIVGGGGRMMVTSWIQHADWDVTVELMGGTLLLEKSWAPKNVKNVKEKYFHLAFADTAFYYCLGGEDKCGVSRLCLGSEILTIAVESPDSTRELSGQVVSKLLKN